ncbi:MAG: BREX system serine/threonine kinase PglW [Microlunatus sp.]
MTPSADPRWVEVSPSQFAHETEGLRYVKDLLPVQAPFRAWSNFEFRDSRGRWHEVDLLVLGRSRLHLVELKYYSGRLRGDDYRWLRDGRRAEDSPLKLARRKAQYLASKLQEEFHTWVREAQVRNVPPVREVVPFIQESVFLHHPGLRCQLPEASAVGLYGLDEHCRSTGLRGISDRLLEPARPGVTIHDRIVAQLMERIGLVPRREREAGSWVIEGEPVGEGEGWQDWDAYHRFAQRERARIRFQIATPGASDEERRRIRRIAEHEFTVMSRLNHEGLLAPRDLVEADLGVGLVYPLQDEWQRLDLWLAERPDGISLATQLAIIRQVGETLQYAHGNRIVHRGIRPGAIWVRENGGSVAVQVRDWQSSGQVAASGMTGSTASGVTALFDPNRLTADDASGLGPFAAPEGALAAGVDRVRVDVFGLGSLAFYLLSGRPPAGSAVGLRDRLREQSGLDLAPELPQVSSILRRAILHATRPAVSERTADVSTFLVELSEEERIDTEHEPVLDPLEASPGVVVDERFRLVRRLGTGSTAVGLLVQDLHHGGNERVLKVAVDDAAGQRLHDEAEVLSGLDNPRLVSLVEGPLTVGGRTALLLEGAGEQTLSQVLSARGRVSLDLLERWGTDLLEALVALDQAGVDHRDIKPSNLGVREVRASRGDRAAHLVLFDFSLSRAAASALRAGTPPYLDPFLGTDDRDRYDSAAERYAAAAVLLEMATGQPPQYGDGLSDPAAIEAEVTLQLDRFDPAVAHPMMSFFQRALARHVEDRQHTAAELLTGWREVFGQSHTTAPDNADELIAAAGLETPLTRSGLSARALSALEPLGVTTVGELVAVDPVRLNRLPGVARATREQIKQAVSQWRGRLGSVRARRGQLAWQQTTLPSPYDLAEILLAPTRSRRVRIRTAVASLILGVTGRADAFATQAQLGAQLSDPVTAARVTQIVGELQDLWAADETTLALLSRLGVEVDDRLAVLGGVATVTELASHLLSSMVTDAETEPSDQDRIAAGVVRIVVDRRRALARADDQTSEYAIRRRNPLPVMIARDTALLDLADELGAEADRLLQLTSPDNPATAILAPIRVNEALIRVVGGVDQVPDSLRGTSRLAGLAAASSTSAAVSSTGELHHRGLPGSLAIARALDSLAAGQALPSSEIRDRVRARFPVLPTLPERPRLDHLIAESGLDLRYDDRERVYRAPRADHGTTGLPSRQITEIVPERSPISAFGVVGQRLADSLARRSFLALGVPARALLKLPTVLEVGYGAAMINISAELIAIMRQQADQVGLSWARVRLADAQPVGSRDAQGIKALVERSLPVLEERVQVALDASGNGPVVLSDAEPVARYGAVARLSRWSDLGISRSRAIWLVVPQLHANQGALLDQKPVPLAAPGQFVTVDSGWVDARYADLTRPTVEEGSPT